MTANFDLVISGGVAVLPDRTVQADIGIVNGRIAEIGSLEIRNAADVFVATGLHVLPGVIDSHVHFREPGFDHKEDLETGSRAAILGGITGVFEMPNTNPPTVSAEALADKMTRAKHRMFCDYAFYLGATAQNARLLDDLERLPGCVGVKVFMGSSTGSLLVEDEATLRTILSRVKKRAAFHCEDEGRLRERRPFAKEGDPGSHPVWRDETAALLAAKRLAALSHEYGKAVHVLHVSTAEEMAFLAAAKKTSRLSVEVTPHHLTFEAPDAYARLGTRVQTNPPVRDARHRHALWDGIASGTVDVIGSDHAPHTLEEKSLSYPQSPSGMTGVQTLVPVMLDHVNTGRLSLERFAALTSANPARLFRIGNRGQIREGYEATFTVVDLNTEREIDSATMASKSQWTPYHGLTVKGWPMATILRGRVVMLDGAVMCEPDGKPFVFAGEDVSHVSSDSPDQSVVK